VAAATPTTAPARAPGAGTATPRFAAPCFHTYLAPFAFTPDGSRLLVRAEAGVQIVNLETMIEERFLAAPAALPGPGVAMAPDGTLAWALADHTIQLVRLPDGEILHTLSGHTGLVTRLVFSSDGRQVYSASHDGWVRIWDMAGREVHAFQPGGTASPAEAVVGLGVSPNGRLLATIPADGPVRLWDLADYSLVRELGGTGGGDTSDVMFSPGGQFVAADLATGLFLWETATGAERLGSSQGINSLAAVFSPDGRWLAYAPIGAPFDIVLASPDTAEPARTLAGHEAPVRALVFSPDGSLLASADGVEIRIWQLADGALRLIGRSDCPAAARRHYDPGAPFLPGVEYPRAILSVADSDLVALACTPDYFSWSGADHAAVDPVTQAPLALADPRLIAFLESARALHPDQSIVSIALCDTAGGRPLVLYRVGPCGGGCAGIPHIAQGQADGTLQLRVVVEPEGDGAYYGCRPLQFARDGALDLACEGEGTNLIRRVQLATGEVTVLLACRDSGAEPICTSP
jgi:hypothetical protein